jgi:hypothetical protein
MLHRRNAIEAKPANDGHRIIAALDLNDGCAFGQATDFSFGCFM